MERKDLKQVVAASLEKRGCSSVKVDLSIAGMQGEAKFREPGFPFKREAHFWYKEKDGRCFLKFEAKDGQEWEDDL